MLSNNIYISQCFHIKTDGKITCPQGTSLFSLIANAAVKAANILLKALMTYIRKGCNPSPLVFFTRL